MKAYNAFLIGIIAIGNYDTRLGDITGENIAWFFIPYGIFWCIGNYFLTSTEEEEAAEYHWRSKWKEMDEVLKRNGH